MTWARKHAATDIRKILSNLLADFDTNQQDIFTEIGAATLAKLNLHPTAITRILADFPHMGCVRRRASTEQVDSGLKIAYTLFFEIEAAIKHTKATRIAKLVELQETVDNYAYAFESHVLNIPHATLFNNVRGWYGARVEVTSQEPIEHAIAEAESLLNTLLAVEISFYEKPFP